MLNPVQLQKQAGFCNTFKSTADIEHIAQGTLKLFEPLYSPIRGAYRKAV